MRRSSAGPWLNLSAKLQRTLIAGARDANPVNGFTNDFYKYPARFSPPFVRSVIETFTKPGDLIIDNHVGGGTTLVESLVLGRNAIGIDISSLAAFVTRVKTTLFSQVELDQLEAWAKSIAQAIDVHKPVGSFTEYEELG